MNQSERNKSILQKYIPQQSTDTIAEWIYKYNFKLRVKKSRSSKTGDYTPPSLKFGRENHTITINHDLNRYEFLITLIHEIAHLSVYEQYGRKANPHGREWKSEYGKLLHHFLMQNKLLTEHKKIFPEELSLALHSHIMRPYAANCSDLSLSRVLKKYDIHSDFFLLEKIPTGSLFQITGTKHSSDVFVKGERRRTRFICIHTHTKRKYFIHALCKVVLYKKDVTFVKTNF